jgi:hypothetical protein
MKKRRRFKQTLSMRERIELWAGKVRDQAALLPPGLQKETLLKKVRTAEAASHLDVWVNSRGLQPPRQESYGADESYCRVRLAGGG